MWGESRWPGETWDLCPNYLHVPPPSIPALLSALCVLYNCNTRLPGPLTSCWVWPMRGTSKRFQVHNICSLLRPTPSGLQGDLPLRSWLLWKAPLPLPLALTKSSHIFCPCPLDLVLVPGCLTILCWFLYSGHTNSPFIKLLFCPLPPVKPSWVCICYMLRPGLMHLISHPWVPIPGSHRGPGRQNALLPWYLTSRPSTVPWDSRFTHSDLAFFFG